jgi:N-acylglucosamine-6-phosphate 2-epimerase
MKTVLDNLKGKLVVSCQALENEPLHSPFIMSRMALAAAQGGRCHSCQQRGGYRGH